MIKNERQYKISRTQLARFTTSLEQLRSTQDPFRSLHEAAHQSQVDELQAEIKEYEDLINGEITSFTASSFSEVPRRLIQARIVKRMTHKALAAALSVSEQQVQRWEAEDYQGTSVETLSLVSNALGVHLAMEVAVVDLRSKIPAVVKSLKTRGFDLKMLQRILPSESFASLHQVSEGETNLWNTMRQLSSVLGISVVKFLEGFMPPMIPGTLGVKYKKSSNAAEAKVAAFTVYAHYVASVIAKLIKVPPESSIPGNWSDFRLELLRKGDISFESVLDYCWERGVVVIPMSCSGAFHGAVWKLKRLYIIILKQGNNQMSRWLFDLLHEVGHVALGHVNEFFSIVEESSVGFDIVEGADDEETEVNEWVEDVLFNGDSAAIEKEVIRRSGGDLRRMKSAVNTTAKSSNLDIGVLANYMAWRLQSQGLDWWGAAQNLQECSASPLQSARDRLTREIDLARLNSIDKNLLIKALEMEVDNGQTTTEA